ncbi:MAG TPA: methyltransferase domain-containing protein [Thermoleophilaceae bacterium]
MKVLELQQCPACGGTDFLAFDLGGGNWLRKCRTCETVSAREYADPAEVYVDGYMFGQAGAFGLDVTHPVFQEYLLRVARRRIALIEGATGARGSLLDVGCGTGEVLFAAREHGWQVQGVEPERTAAEMTRERGIPVEVAPLEDSGLRERSYDVVTAFHVLEHVPDSRAFLRMLARWARPGGHVAVEVPNWGSSARRRHGNNWSGLRPLEHLVHFTPKTLLRTFRAAGLDPVLSRSPVYLGPPQTLEHALDDLVRHGRFRKVIEPLSPYRQVNGDSVRVPSAAGWKLLRAVEAVYDRAGTGGVVLCVARVP